MASVRLDRSRLCFIKDVLTADQCQDIIDHFNNKKQSPASTHTYGITLPVNSKVRSGLVVLEKNTSFPHYDKIYKHVAQYLIQTGIITSEIVTSQFTIYSTPGDHFQSHVDAAADIHTDDQFFNGENKLRKVSVSIHLSPPSNYTGCKLQFPIAGKDKQWKSFDQDQGTMLIFPSFFKHRVTELHSGTRYSMVLWYHGKNWT